MASNVGEIVGLGALAVVLVVLVNHVGGNVVSTVGAGVGSDASSLGASVQGQVENAQNTVGQTLNNASSTLSGAGPIGQGLALGNDLLQNGVSGVASQAGSGVGGFFSGVGATVSNGISGISSWFSG